MRKIYAGLPLMQLAQLQLDNPILLAPMAGISNLPYRRIMKRFGAALVYSEMVSANGLIRAGRRTFELVRSCPDEKPLGVQLFGDDAEILARGAALLEEHADLLDLNCGCPVNKVIRSGAGSALLREPRKIGLIVASIRRVTSKPLTVKIRSGWSRESLCHLEVGRIAADAGADAIILHPRTRSQGFGGHADWTQIAELKQALPIPVIGSGDIVTPDDALRMLRQTGCDGVMIGRGAYGNPWLLRNILRRLAGEPELQPTAEERLQVILDHMDYHCASFGVEKTVFEMRKHLCWYARGMAGAADFRQRINHLSSLEEQRSATMEFFSAAADSGGEHA